MMPIVVMAVMVVPQLLGGRQIINTKIIPTSMVAKVIAKLARQWHLLLVMCCPTVLATTAVAMALYNRDRNYFRTFLLCRFLSPHIHLHSLRTFLLHTNNGRGIVTIIKENFTITIPIITTIKANVICIVEAYAVVVLTVAKRILILKVVAITTGMATRTFTFVAIPLRRR